MITSHEDILEEQSGEENSSEEFIPEKKLKISKKSARSNRKRKNSSNNTVSNKKPEIKITRLDAIDSFLKLGVNCEKSTKEHHQPLRKVLYSKTLNENWCKTNTFKLYNNYFSENKLQLNLNKPTKFSNALCSELDGRRIALVDQIAPFQYKLRLYKHYFELKEDNRANEMQEDSIVNFSDYAYETGMFKDNRNKHELKAELDIFCNLANLCDEKSSLVDVLRIKYTNFRYDAAKNVNDYNTNFLKNHELKINSAEKTTKLYDVKMNEVIACIDPPERKLQLSAHYFKLQEKDFPLHLAKNGWVYYSDLIDISRTADKIKRINAEIIDFKEFIEQCAIYFKEQMKTIGFIDSFKFISQISPYKSIEAYVNDISDEKADLQISFRINKVVGFLYSLHDDLTNKPLIGLTRETFEIMNLKENHPQLNTLEEEIKSTNDNNACERINTISTQLDSNSMKYDSQDESQSEAPASPPESIVSSKNQDRIPGKGAKNAYEVINPISTQSDPWMEYDSQNEPESEAPSPPELTVSSTNKEDDKKINYSPTLFYYFDKINPLKNPEILHTEEPETDTWVQIIKIKKITNWF